MNLGQQRRVVLMRAVDDLNIVAFALFQNGGDINGFIGTDQLSHQFFPDALN